MQLFATTPIHRRGLAALAVAAITVMPNGIAEAASPDDGMYAASLAIAAYDVSRAQCVYSDALVKALADLDAFLARAHGDQWTRLKREGPGLTPLLRNAGRMTGARSKCESLGKGVGGAQAIYRDMGGTNLQVLDELKALADGGGRSPSEEVVTRPPPPPLSLETSDPGPAAATARALSRQFPDMNKSVEPEGPGTTLRRLPQDGGPSRASPSRPALPPPGPSAAQPGGTAQGSIATVPGRQAQGTPQPPPPAVAAHALPPAGPAPVPPGGAATASSTAAGSDACRVGAVCRLPEPTFACTSAEAQRLAAAGLVQGRQAGLAAARAGACEIVAAGRPLLFEATQTPGVVYATENGKHVGYLPLSVFAPAGSTAATTCTPPGFCALRAEAGAWGCRRADDLDLPTPEARRAAKCVQLGAGQVGEVASPNENTEPISLRIGGNPPYLGSYYFARTDLAGITVQPTPTPVERGWCRPGDWCVINTPTILCAEKATYQRILAAPAGEARRAAILAAQGCRIVLRGNPMKPGDPPATDDASKLIEAEHPVFKAGWTSANAFGAVAYDVPIRYTARLSDIVVGADRAADLVALALSAQGTRQATAVFRSRPQERQAFCRANAGAENVAPYRTCLGEADASLEATADCNAKRLTLDGERFGLAERPRDAEPDVHIDLHRRRLF